MATEAEPRLIAIAKLNALSEQEFVAALKVLFEAAEPLAHALFAQRPFASYDAVIDTAERLTADMSFDDQVAVLSAHPRIGENAAAVSALSFREQGYAAEQAQDAALEHVYTRLAQLNREYEDHFGFRFVVFVNKRPKAEIVKVLEARLNNPRGAELTTGLRDMFLIARDRLCTLS